MADHAFSGQVNDISTFSLPNCNLRNCTSVFKRFFIYLFPLVMDRTPSYPEIAMVIIQVAGHNIVCVVLFIFKAHLHTYLVDPKTTKREEGRADIKSTLRMRTLKYKE